MERHDQAPEYLTGELVDIERKKAREQHIKQLLEDAKSTHIPEQIFLRPLHKDPAQHLELLSVFLLFRTRFSALPTHEQNMYTWGSSQVPLFAIFDKDFVSRRCDEFGIALDRVQLLVDKLWVEKVFASTSFWMRDLRVYTDEDFGSDRFRKAVGLPVRKGEQHNEVEEQMSVEDELKERERNVQELKRLVEKEVGLQGGRPPNRISGSGPVSRPRSRPGPGPGPEVVPVGGRSKPPTKDRLLTITSATSAHGGKKNIYNPSLLRRPKNAIPNPKYSQSTRDDLGFGSRYPAVLVGKPDNTNSRSPTITSDASRVQQSTRTNTQSLSYRQKTSVAPNPHSANPIQNTFGAGSEATSTSSNTPETMNSPLLAVASDASFVGDPMDVDIPLLIHRLSSIKFGSCPVTPESRVSQKRKRLDLEDASLVVGFPHKRKRTVLEDAALVFRVSHKRKISDIEDATIVFRLPPKRKRWDLEDATPVVLAQAMAERFEQLGICEF
ncbi:hypothetical protein NHQ30_009335 [Ciborinia camelliae]|nr:hypothetical protein NHQ30_009335 [Ciborinia camelliae]